MRFVFRARNRFVLIFEFGFVAVWSVIIMCVLKMVRIVFGGKMEFI